MAIIWGNPPLAIAVNALQRLVDVAVRPGRGDEKAVVFLRDTVAIDATVSRRRKFYERRNIVAIREGIGAHFSYICNFEGYNMGTVKVPTGTNIVTSLPFMAVHCHHCQDATRARHVQFRKYFQD